MATRIRKLGLLAVLLALGLLAAKPASATPEMLRRSVGNLIQWPLDLVLSPAVAAYAIVKNMREVNDSPAVRIVYPLPGWLWLTGVQAGAAILRGVSGVLEFFPGLFLIASDRDIEPLFDPVERNEAFVDHETPVLWIKFGVDYTSAPL